MEIDYEIIALYLDDKLSSEQRIEFENKLKTDHSFKQDFDLYLEVQNSLSKKYQNEKGVSDLKETLSKITNPKVEQKIEVEKKTFIQSNLFRIVSLAAVFIIGFFVLKPQTSLYNQYAQHSLLEIQVKGDNNALLLEAAELYNNGNYKEAIPKLDDYLLENPEDIEIIMALGIAFLETHNVKDAQKLFSQVYGMQNVFKNKAAWYMALSYLKLEDIEQTKAFLGDIESSSSYYEDAQELLKKL